MNRPFDETDKRFEKVDARFDGACRWFEKSMNDKNQIHMNLCKLSTQFDAYNGCIRRILKNNDLFIQQSDCFFLC